MRYDYIRFPDENPEDPRFYIPNIEFYITNVCNLACPQCNRFNDWNFSGYQKWRDYKDDYTKWSKKVRLQRICILGGEPLLNPTICEWITGINKLWDKRVQVLTNGTRLNAVPGLYDAINSYRKDGGNWLGISIHNMNDLNKHFDEAKKFLKGKISYSEGRNNPETWGAGYAFSDENGVHLHYWKEDDFYQAAVQKVDGKFVLHNSDPEQAHSKCGFVKSMCYHFIKAKLYKCGPVALFPEFDDQHKFDISEEDRKLLHNYQPLSVHQFDNYGKDFIYKIDDVIPQCKFCPSSRDDNEIIESINKAKNAESSFNPRR